MDKPVMMICTGAGDDRCEKTCAKLEPHVKDEECERDPRVCQAIGAKVCCMPAVVCSGADVEGCDKECVIREPHARLDVCERDRWHCWSVARKVHCVPVEAGRGEGQKLVSSEKARK